MKNKHITVEETYDVSYAMFKTLSESCPGCAMSILSMLTAMLCVEFTKRYEKEEEIFDPIDWLKCMDEMTKTAVYRYEHMDNSVN